MDVSMVDSDDLNSIINVNLKKLKNKAQLYEKAVELQIMLK